MSRLETRADWSEFRRVAYCLMTDRAILVTGEYDAAVSFADRAWAELGPPAEQCLQSIAVDADPREVERAAIAAASRRALVDRVTALAVEPLHAELHPLMVCAASGVLLGYRHAYAEECASRAWTEYLTSLSNWNLNREGRPPFPSPPGGTLVNRAWTRAVDERERLANAAVPMSQLTPVQDGLGGDDQWGFDEPPALAPTPEDLVAAREISGHLRACRDRLANDEFFAVVLRQHDYSYRDIADMLGVAPNTVRARYQLGLASLLQCLESRGINLNDLPEDGVLSNA